jgi:putative copper resistance protein D
LDLLLETGRLLTYAGALQLFGVAAFQCWLAAPPLRAALEPQTRPTAILSALFLVVGQLIWLAATAGTMADGWSSAFDPPTLWLVLTATAFGRVWGPLLLIGAILLVIAVIGRGRWMALSIISGLALCGLGLVGHAAMSSGAAGVLNPVSQALHLLSSAFWVGCLIPLLFCLSLFRHPDHGTEAAAALKRFSGLGHGAVAVLLLSGVANSYFVLSGATIDPTRPYQALLIAKVAIAGIMVCLAVINRYVFVPKMPNKGPGLAQLVHGTIAEIVLSAIILGLVSVIGTLSPS